MKGMPSLDKVWWRRRDLNLLHSNMYIIQKRNTIATELVQVLTKSNTYSRTKSYVKTKPIQIQNRIQTEHCTKSVSNACHWKVHHMI